MKSISLFLIGVLLSFSSQAIYLKGFVYDDNTGNSIADASLQLRAGKKTIDEAASSFNGSFLFNVSKGKPYTLVVKKAGYVDYSVMIEDVTETDPILEIFLQPLVPTLYGRLLATSDKIPLTFREIKCIDLTANSEDITMTDETGRFQYELNSNTSYRFYFRDSNQEYAAASLFISTIGADKGLKINKQIVTQPISSAGGMEEVPGDWDLINTDEEEIQKYSNPEASEIVTRKYDDSVYVTNKKKPLISFNKKRQKKREEDIETIYFYADFPGDMEDEEQTVLREKIDVEKVEKVEEPVEVDVPVPDADAEIKVDEVVPAEEKDLVEEQIMEEFEEAVVEEEEIASEEELVSEVEDKVDESIKIKVDEPKKKEEKVAAPDERIKTKTPGKTRRVIIKKSDGKIIELDKDGNPIEEEQRSLPDILDPSKSSVYFAKGKAFLTDKAKEFLDRFAKKLTDDPRLKLTLSSHTDAGIEYTIEQQLARMRAESVMAYLLEKGVVFDQLSIRVVGNKQPANECKYGVECTEDQHKVNRRVDLLYQQNKPY